VPALEGYGGIFYRNTICSGYIPRSRPSWAPRPRRRVLAGTDDWVFMIKGKSYMYITGPDVIKAVIGEEVTTTTWGGPMAHASRAACAISSQKATRTASSRSRPCWLPARQLPRNAPVVPSTDKPDRDCPELDKIIPDRATRGYEHEKVVAAWATAASSRASNSRNWARNMFVCFIASWARPWASSPTTAVRGGVLDVNASDKASRFIRFCDAFNIPLLTFADVPGYMPGTHQEWNGIISHGAKLRMPLLRGHGAQSSPSWTRKD